MRTGTAIVKAAVPLIDVDGVTGPEWPGTLVEKLDNDEGVVTQAVHQCTFEGDQTVGSQEKNYANAEGIIGTAYLKENSV